MEKRGITIAGNILVDNVKRIDCYPAVGTLSNITEISRSVGGCVPNTAIDLAKIDPTLPVKALGKIGDDEPGQYVLAQLKRYGIDCDGIRVSSEKPTSFSDVMSLYSGERTFFHARGANAAFSPEDIDIEALNCEILHIGYLLLLDRFDQTDPAGGTVMAQFLKQVQKKGIKTSIDAVSDNTADYAGTILPALPYCDFAILNELESSRLSGLPPYDEDGRLLVKNIEKTMRFMAESGVKEKVIVHCKQAGFCYDVPTDTFTVQPSLSIPRHEIKGSVGAGDAFCAGCLYAIEQGFSDLQMLTFAASAAACNLFSENSVDGMKSRAEIEALAVQYGQQKMGEETC
ncbi:MAG: carbohydrate kinase family protein [Clostridia bacterium]|nr:carbohydrate kinase family protein [Clostridia bacterium]